MTKKIGGVVIIEDEKNRECQYCGEDRETRPYGEGGKRICNPCMRSIPGMLEICKQNFSKLIK